MLRLFGKPEDRAKVAAAFRGQGTSADHVQAIMLRYWRELGAVPYLQVHDELVWEQPATWTDKQAFDFIALMQEETWRLPGFSVPADAMRGPNWKDLKKLVLE
jgi:DNA polymerase I-like protein with 3'-5' exonuclease and polymerase domains